MGSRFRLEASFFAFLVAMCFVLGVPLAAHAEETKVNSTPNIQDTMTADDVGLPQVLVDGVREYNPAILAALMSAKERDPAPRESRVSMHPLAQKAADKIASFMQRRDVEVDGQRRQADLLLYRFRYVHAGQTFLPPFSSSFAQAQYLLSAVNLFQKNRTDAARQRVLRAANGFFIDVKEGGFTTYLPDGNVWFEELPSARPTHVLNAHLLAIMALEVAGRAVGSNDFEKLVKLGRNALESRFSMYDAGNFARYDLAPQKDVVFSLEPYCDVAQLADIADRDQVFVTKIDLADPASSDASKSSVEIAAEIGSAGRARLIGAWSDVAERIPNHIGRSPGSRLFAAYNPVDIMNLDGLALLRMGIPHGASPDVALTLRFVDNAPGTLCVKLQDPHVAHDDKFIDLGKIRTSGDGNEKVATFQIKRVGLSNYIGWSYQTRHLQLLAWYKELFNYSGFDGALKRYATWFLEYGDSPPIRPIAPVRNIVPFAITSITGASDTAPHDARALVDGKIETNVGTSTGEPADFVIELDDVYELRGLSLVNYGDGGSTPLQMDIFTGNAPDKLTLVDTVKANLLQGNEVSVRFPRPHDARFLRLRFPSFRGQQRFLVRELKLFANPDAIYARDVFHRATGRDADRPWNIKVTARDVRAVSAWMEDNLRLDFCNLTPSIKMYLSEGKAQCGDRVYIIRSMLEYFGVPTRTINFYNAPSLGDGHSAVEYFMYDQWNYLDPSFGLYVPKKYVATASEGLTGTPTASEMSEFALFWDGGEGKKLQFDDVFTLAGIPAENIAMSLQEIRRLPEMIDVRGWRSEQFWPMKDRPRSNGNPVVPGYEGGVFTSAALYENSNPAGPVGPTEPLFFPIKVPEAGVSLGRIDGVAGPNSASDLDSGVTSQIPAGISYIGVSIENRNTRFVFPDGPAGGEYKITIVPAYVSKRDMTISAHADGAKILSKPSVVLGFTGFRPDTSTQVSFCIEQEKPDATIDITHDADVPGQYMTIDAIKVTRSKCAGAESFSSE